jgi:hypothetical protein
LRMLMQCSLQAQRLARCWLNFFSNQGMGPCGGFLKAGTRLDSDAKPESPIKYCPVEKNQSFWRLRSQFSQSQVSWLHPGHPVR